MPSQNSTARSGSKVGRKEGRNPATSGALALAEPVHLTQIGITARVDITGSVASGLQGLQPGHYHRQYLAASRSQGWGELGSKCGGTVLLRVDEVTGQKTLIPALCKQFSCRLCGPMRAAWLKRNIKKAQVENNLHQFVTLTLQVKGRTSQESFKAIGGYFHTLQRALDRRHEKHYGYKWRMSYIWTVEPTKRGIAHLHLLKNGQDTPSEISECWHKATGDSYIVEAEEVSTARAGDYLCKYVTKQAGIKGTLGYEFLHHKRLFGKSADVCFEEFIVPSDKPGWTRLNVPYWQAYREMAASAPVVKARHLGVPSSTFVSAGTKHDYLMIVSPEEVSARDASLTSFAADIQSYSDAASDDDFYALG